MASTEMVQIDPSLIFSPPTTPRASPNLLSLNASLSSSAESHVLSPPAPSVEDLNQLNEELTQVELSRAEESKDDKPAEVFDSETDGSGEDDASRDLIGFDKAGWEPLWEGAILYEPHCDDHATVSGLPLLQRGGGFPILLEIPFDCDPYFRPFHSTSSSDGADKIPSTTVNGKAHGSGDGGTVRDLPAFRRSGGDAMGYDPVDLAFYMYHDTSCNAPLTKRTSRLQSRGQLDHINPCRWRRWARSWFCG